MDELLCIINKYLEKDKKFPTLYWEDWLYRLCEDGTLEIVGYEGQRA